MIRDEEGVLVTDLQVAVIYAMEVVQELRAEDPTSVAEWQGWRLDITDDTGRVIESLALDDPRSRKTSRH
ncbi:DUF6894 family protein [Microvirga sp. M2]|uniref:DUF6894 family protein n=1 Tax=Microvirga sp. M2 TaxID=3073270 RepID=UPI0039C4A16D